MSVGTGGRCFLLMEGHVATCFLVADGTFVDLILWLRIQGLARPAWLSAARICHLEKKG